MSHIFLSTFGELAVQGPPRERLHGRVGDLLLLLVSGNGEWISRDELILRLWDGEQGTSKSRRSALRTYVAKLRTVLGEVAIITRDEPCAYRLNRDIVATDLDELRRLFEVATSLSQTNATSAFPVISEALHLTAGEPLAGCDLAWVRPTSSSVAELVLQVEDLFCRMAIAAGVSETELDHIQQLATKEPLREVRTEMLMRALVSLGHRHKALLVAYQHTRLIRSETGLAPCNEIRLLEQEILGEQQDESDAEPLSQQVLLALALEVHEATTANITALLGVEVDEVTNTVGLLRQMGLLTIHDNGKLAATSTVQVDDLIDQHRGDSIRIRRGWAEMEALPRWRQLDHLLRVALAGNNHISDSVSVRAIDSTEVHRVASLACGATQFGAALALLTSWQQFSESERTHETRRTPADAHLGRLHAEVLEHLGFAQLALERRTAAVDDALLCELTEHATLTASPDPGVSRSYRDNQQSVRLLERTLAKVNDQTHTDQAVRLLADLVCQQVLDTGLTADLKLAYDRLQNLAAESRDLESCLYAYQATLFVAVSEGSLIDSRTLSANTALAQRIRLHSPLTTFLAVRARIALNEGNRTEWSSALEAVRAHWLTTRAPIDTWMHLALEAVDLQLDRQAEAAQRRSAQALAFGEKHAVPDCEASFEVFQLAEEWQHDAFSKDAHNQGIGTTPTAFAHYALASSSANDVASKELWEALIETTVRSAQTQPKSLESLPSLAIATQVCWNVSRGLEAADLLTALNSWTNQAVIPGLFPVAHFGPTSRYRALAAVLSGEYDVAEREFETAEAWCQSMNATAWAAVVLTDRAKLEDRLVTGRGAKLRAEAALLRHIRRVAIVRPPVPLSP